MVAPFDVAIRITASRLRSGTGGVKGRLETRTKDARKKLDLIS